MAVRRTSPPSLNSSARADALRQNQADMGVFPETAHNAPHCGRQQYGHAYALQKQNTELHKKLKSLFQNCK